MHITATTIDTAPRNQATGMLSRFARFATKTGRNPSTMQNVHGAKSTARIMGISNKPPRLFCQLLGLIAKVIKPKSPRPEGRGKLPENGSRRKRGKTARPRPSNGECRQESSPARSFPIVPVFKRRHKPVSRIHDPNCRRHLGQDAALNTAKVLRRDANLCSEFGARSLGELVKILFQCHALLIPTGKAGRKFFALFDKIGLQRRRG